MKRGGTMEDRRLRRTRERLRESLLELLGEKDLRSVTVKELTDRADVNRGTFYSHYQDIYDMLDQLEAEVFGEFTALLDAYTQADLERGLDPILRDVFCFVDRHAGLCLRLMAGDQENAFFQRLRREIHRRAMEDWGELYGFASRAEKRCFDMLVGVSGVGPKAALSILSSSTPEALAMAVISGDERALTVAPGIGKKIAQRVILELKDKMAKESPGLDMSSAVGAPAVSAAGEGKLSDAVAALGVLGYGAAEINSALKGIDTDAMGVEEIIKAALKNMMK